MKIVINRCFGGFGLSNEAERALIGCPHVELMEPEKYYGGRSGWEQQFKEDQSRGVGSLFTINVYDGKIVIDKHRDSAARSCIKLVEVVEQMGEAANSSLAELAVVEIPDGVEWEIDEYDGIEHIAEVHRTWP